MSERVDLKALREVAERACDDPRVRLDNQDYAEVTQSGGFQAMVATDADAQFMLLFGKREALALITAVEAALEFVDGCPVFADGAPYVHEINNGREFKAMCASLAPFRESDQ